MALVRSCTVPRRGDGPFLFSTMLRRPRWHANAGTLWFRPDVLALAADAELCAPFAAVERDRRSVTVALAASAGVHGAIAILAALAIGGGGAAIKPVSSTALRATLTTPPQRFAAPEAPPTVSVQPISPPTESHSPRPGAIMPLTLPPPPASKVEGTGLGRVIVHIAEPEESPEPRVLFELHRVHPGIVRVALEFEVEPAGEYPHAALADRLQLIVPVVVIVHLDGRLELAPGTFDEPVFAASIREALAAARASPPKVDGKAATGWALLLFYYEFVGGDSATSPVR